MKHRRLTGSGVLVACALMCWIVTTAGHSREEQSRINSPAPDPSPSPTATPKAAKSPKPKPKPSPSPGFRPSPTPIASPTPEASPTQTLLKPNQLITFSLAPGQEKVFVLQMKEGDFADVQWLAGRRSQSFF